MTATRVLFNADVRTMDASGRKAHAVAWRDGKVLAVGTHDEVAQIAGDGAERWDAGGATVLPGFIDAHHHPCIVALYGGLLQLAPPRVTDIASLQRAVADAAKNLSPGEWLVAAGWDEALIAERRAPTRQDLDDAVPNHPVLAFHYGCHRAVANSRALELAGIDKNTPDPSGGIIERGAGGVPSGLLIERGMSRVEKAARGSLIAKEAEGFMTRLGEHHRMLLAAGITRVIDCTVPRDLADLYREAEERGLLSVPTVMLPVSMNGYLETPWDVLDGQVTGEEKGLLSVGPIKLVLDGAPGCALCLSWWQSAGMMLRTWAMMLRHRSLDPVRTMMSTAPRMGTSIRTGVRIYQRDEAHKIVQAAVERGFGVAQHAIGNEAIDVALSAFQSAGPRLHIASIPRIEHATLVSRELVERVAAIGAAVVMQPNFLGLPAFGSAPSIPGLRNTALRWMLDAGVRVAGSSDFPVAGYDPLDAIRCAVTRRTTRGHVHEPDQCITLDEALAMYTRTAAEVSGCLGKTGSLERGKRADIVVLNGALDEGETLAKARVRATVLAGEVVHGTPTAGTLSDDTLTDAFPRPVG